MWRHSHRLAERLGKMELAHAGRHREMFERQRFVNVRVNVLDRSAKRRPMRAAATPVAVTRAGVRQEDMRSQSRSELFGVERRLRVSGPHLAVERHAEGTD